MKKSLNFKLLTWAALSIFVVASTLTAFSAYNLYQEILKRSSAESHKYAESMASEIELKIAKAFELNRSFSKSLAQIKDKNHPIKLSRDEVLKMMEIQFKDHTTIFGFNTGWEPNAFDGRDADFANKAPYDQTGRMIPYMTRKADGTVKVEPLVDYDKEGAGDYYLLPKKLKKDLIIPPYSYPVDGKTILMITLTSPIVVDDEFFGEVGSDIDLSFFQTLADSETSLPKGSRIAIFDNTGTIVGFTKHADYILKNIFKEKIPQYENYSIERLKDKNQLEILGKENYSILTELHLEDETWFIEIIIPKSEILGPIYNEIFTLVGVSITLALLALGIGYFIVKKITGSIIALSERLKKSAASTRQGSNTVKDAATQVSSATHEQASAIQETATTLEEISAMVAKSVDNAKNSSVQANNSYNIAEEGKTAVEQMRLAMVEIKASNANIVEQIEVSNKEIEGIIKVIQDISDKTKVINDIVFQTKLLSFNASVEAARAGEQGKGFAVVAEEVGNLAAMSGNSSQEINQLLEKSISSVETIIQDTRRRVEVLVRDGLERVETGTRVAERCEQILSQIVTNVESVKELMGEVTMAAEEQAKGVKNISEAMNMLDTTTQSNSQTVHKTAEQSEILYHEADNLNEIINELENEVYGQRS